MNLSRKSNTKKPALIAPRLPQTLNLQVIYDVCGLPTSGTNRQGFAIHWASAMPAAPRDRDAHEPVATHHANVLLVGSSHDLTVLVADGCADWIVGCGGRKSSRSADRAQS